MFFQNNFKFIFSLISLILLVFSFSISTIPVSAIVTLEDKIKQSQEQNSEIRNNDEVILGTIRGTIWIDINQDGDQMPGLGGLENPYFPGITLRLHTFDPIANTTTFTGLETVSISSVESYIFPNLPTNQVYKVEIVPPAGWVLTLKDNLGTDDTFDSDFNTVTFFTDVVYPASSSIPWTDAGLFNTASVGNQVWMDINQNGLMDSGETGVNGITVTLLDNLGNLAVDDLGNIIPAQITRTVGSLDGFYRFNNLPAGDYIIRFSNLPPEFERFTNNLGNLTDTLNSDVNPTTGEVAFNFYYS
jgi:hypothetical protein